MKTINDIYKHFKLSDYEIKKVENIFRVENLKKGDYFLRKGERCNKMGMLLDGSFYAYAYNEKGEEKIVDFFYPSENDIIFDYASYIRKQISNHDIKCFQKASLIVFKIERIIELYEEIPRFFELENIVMQQHFLKALQRIDLLQSKNASERIRMLKDQMPEIFTIFPYSYIASYLGLHRNTFNNALKEI